MARGWRYDSYKHSLAAQGIKTNYYAKKKSEVRIDIGKTGLGDSETISDAGTKATESAVPSKTAEALSKVRSVFSFRRGQETPGTLAQRAKDTTNLRKVTTDLARNERTVNTALASLKEGNPSEVVSLLSIRDSKGNLARLAPTGKIIQEGPKAGEPEMKMVPLESGEIVALKTALASTAMQYAQAGQHVPDEIMTQLDSADQKRIKSTYDAKTASMSAAEKEALETPMSRQLKKDLSALAGQVADAPSEGFEDVEAWGGATGGPGIVTRINELGKTEFVKTNASVGHEEDGIASPFGNFAGGKVPNLSSAFDFAGGGAGTNPILARTPSELRRKAEIVQDQVDSLYDARDELSKADLSAYERGNEAFEHGNREKLIDSIADLQTEESKLKDRWDLIGQTHRNMQSLENHTSSFQKSSDVNPLWGIGKQGGSQLADQTTKINKVREAVIKENNKVFARKRMLQFRLQRLDATVPTENHVPNKVMRFERPDKGFLKSVDNPVMDSFNKGVFK